MHLNNSVVSAKLKRAIIFYLRELIQSRGFSFTMQKSDIGKNTLFRFVDESQVKIDTTLRALYQI